MRRAVDNPVDGAAVDELMRRALAATAGTYPHPNPRVGAIVITPQGVLRALAAHRGAGEAHAERLALAELSETDGDTMIVTLEPCDHHGRTPPCTDAIIESGIARVIVGTLDPDPRVRGSGMAKLRSAGIEVVESGLGSLVEANDPGYFHHRRTGRPLVTLKVAATLDGQSAAADGTSQWITSLQAREDGHRIRSENDVVIVGAGTVLSDDPTLTVRLEGYDGPQPRPVIIAGTRDLPSDRRVFARDPIVYRSSPAGEVDPAEVVRDLGERGIVAAMIEGGPSVAGSFLRSGVVDQIIWYVAARLALGTGTPAIAGTFATMGDIRDITITDVVRIGSDIKITATLGKER
ncbi:MAG: bifunctional diaminohydroxyphosphoribosylaminopyrimidine deaminase/5-amino-6-(5-phosphoribosylamino)uracil reductase RibD [Actinomycetota bacterium]|nr:bifunctional diaminohydroxyphosphoribosylaminopyrimidine deaminase/5-amino-6-(5-phosphoribosylamino)uracil reductase RibD [Actinomycetota bacterium]